ncbi:MAG: N-6 DNA methylase [Ruminococcaceae bacterium]|nr:N-6 DNA methylase [Oscillospiraceae bacterium]
MKKNLNQLTFFDFLEDSSIEKITNKKEYSKGNIILNEETIRRLKSYNLDDYISDVRECGLEKTWDNICQFVIDNKEEIPEFINTKNFAELYEIGLATQDKVSKKKAGQYYTPDDVASLMSEWLNNCEGDNVCDVACGTGKLILTYLDLIGYEEARKLISSGRLYLYDVDNVALKICWTTIAIKYGLDIADSINDIFCDFLDQSITLPENCKVISNPPYAHLSELQGYWEQTEVLLESREYYSAFMEKIFAKARSTVIITPFSFISGNKFRSLRRKMCEIGSGHIVSFDNVPGNIFCGRKHGIFNTNTSNSVRAAITVLKQGEKRGFRVSPLIRFRNEERKELLKTDVLESVLPDNYQLIDGDNDTFQKIDKCLVDVYKTWIKKSNCRLKDIVSKDKTCYFIDMPNTCRYYTTASSGKLNRTGSITVYLNNTEDFSFLYCFINSSFAYWWWRIYDGGITYPFGLLYNMPLPVDLLSEDDKDFFAKMSKKMIETEKDYIVTKLNAGVEQENIKFPEQYRNEINVRILKMLGHDCDASLFKTIHANRFFI